MTSNLEEIFQSFAIRCSYKCHAVLKVGHIHDTYVSVWDDSGVERRYIHQKLNGHVFPNLTGLMENIVTVTEHIKSRLDPAENYCTLTLVPAKTGGIAYQDEESGLWRTFEFIEGTKGHESCPSAEVAFESGVVCGKFAYYVSDLDPQKLKVTIPDFINTSFRYEQLKQSIKEDRADRVTLCKKEIEYALSQEKNGSSLMESLKSKKIPYRVSHNDTKIDNILFDLETDKGVVIVDLDTCMAGSPLFDYGDLVRTCALHAPEDEVELDNIAVEPEFYEAVRDGYLSGTKDFLTEAERELMPMMPAIVSLTLGVRFLTDYLNGDTYFRVHRENHNYDRARAQLEVSRKLATYRY